MGQNIWALPPHDSRLKFWNHNVRLHNTLLFLLRPVLRCQSQVQFHSHAYSLLLLFIPWFLCSSASVWMEVGIVTLKFWSLSSTLPCSSVVQGFLVEASIAEEVSEIVLGLVSISYWRSYLWNLRGLDSSFLQVSL